MVAIARPLDPSPTDDPALRLGQVIAVARVGRLGVTIIRDADAHRAGVHLRDGTSRMIAPAELARLAAEAENARNVKDVVAAEVYAPSELSGSESGVGPVSTPGEVA